MTIADNIRGSFATGLEGSCPTNVAMKDISPFLASYAASSLVPDLVGFMKDPEAVTSAASRSYLHGNGFFKIVLAQSAHWKLRLHVWPKGVDAEENIHEHRWNFSSTVLCGALHSETYLEDATTSAHLFDEWLYLAKEGESEPSQMYVGKTRLTCTQTIARHAGEHYSMNPNTMHRIIRTADQLTATLMLQSAPARRSNRLLTTPGFVANVSQRYITPAEVGAVVDCLITELTR